MPDSSILVAGFLPDHPFHLVAEAALAEVQTEGRLVAHTTAEAFSVLSSPGSYRADPDLVVGYLDGLLGGSPPIQPRPETYPEAFRLLAENGRGGGAVFDALIALAARDAGAELVSLDRRAGRIYDLCGVEARLLSG